MGHVVTKEELRERALTSVVLPAWSRETGEPRGVRIRRLTASELRALQPPPIPGSEEWPAEERAARVRAWLEALPDAERRQQQAAWLDLDFQIIAAAVVEPPGLTPEEARFFGLDTDYLIVEILAFSGFLKRAGDSPAATEA